MRERIIKFLTAENISSAKFADEIGVQRSSVSHILSGRNNPGFDFIQKMLTRYKNLNAEWLIMGTGNMIKTMRQGNLFEDVSQSVSENPILEQSEVKSEIVNDKQHIDIQSLTDVDTQGLNKQPTLIETIKQDNSKQIEKVLIFYTDKTFATYLPEN